MGKAGLRIGFGTLSEVTFGFWGWLASARAANFTGQQINVSGDFRL
ncbi:MAG: hypothetical protein ACKOPM_11555 [Novosphingobium sp.]